MFPGRMNMSVRTLSFAYITHNTRKLKLTNSEFLLHAWLSRYKLFSHFEILTLKNTNYHGRMNMSPTTLYFAYITDHTSKLKLTNSEFLLHAWLSGNKLFT